jgi:3-oxoacyl-ACP reductase-like protein
MGVPTAVIPVGTHLVDSVQRIESWTAAVPTTVPATAPVAAAAVSAADPAAPPAEYYQPLFYLWELRALRSTLSQKPAADSGAELKSDKSELEQEASGASTSRMSQLHHLGRPT